jgi:CsoR family transcriptional regulator, copper-sensing transcriptional repressor
VKHRPPPDHCRAPSEPSALRESEHAKAVDRRLARIEGQIRGVRRMVSEGRYCMDVLAQVQAVQESLKSTSALLLEAHLRSCVTEAFLSGADERKEVVLKELSGLLAGK